MDNTSITRINIVNKTPSCFRKGYWDVDLKYVIEYRLIFTDANGNLLCCVPAVSVFATKITLFGSVGCDLFVSTDLLGSNGMFEAMPFILAEGKAVPLSASFIYDYPKCGCNPCNPCDTTTASASASASTRQADVSSLLAVEVTIGLFSIVKLFRLVDLAIESRGFTIPAESEEISPMNPCDYFDSLDFPMDMFAPPQKPEFVAGVSNNIPAAKRNTNNCDDCCR
jgi:hypothetical protein